MEAAIANRNRVAKNTRIRSETAEQYKHCTMGRSKLNHCAKERMDIMRVRTPRTSPLLTARGLGDSKPATATVKINHCCVIAFITIML